MSRAYTTPDGAVRWRGGYYEVPGESIGEEVELLVAGSWGLIARIDGQGAGRGCLPRD